MQTNYILIDYENVQPINITALNQQFFRVIVFVGATQSSIPYAFASAMQAMGSRAQYVKICNSGKNALDFHITFYLGQLTLYQPAAHFHIISKDSGFDPLIEHLKGLKIQVRRWQDITDIPLVKSETSKSRAEVLNTIVSNLRKCGTAKPGTVTTLANSINTLFHGKLTSNELTALINELQKQSVISVKDTRVSYHLPT